MRAAVFCQGSTAKGRQIANTGMRKAPAPVNRIAPAARAKLSWLGIPEASSAVCSKPPAVQRSADTAKTMLASGVPGSLAARRVRTSSRTVIRNPVVKPIKSPAKYGPADMVTTCNVLTRIAMYGDARPAACRGRGGPRGQSGLRWGRRFRLPRPLAGDSCSRLLSRRSEILLFLASDETGGGPVVPDLGAVQKSLAAPLAGGDLGEFPVTVGEDENRLEVARVACPQRIPTLGELVQRLLGLLGLAFRRQQVRPVRGVLNRTGDASSLALRWQAEAPAPPRRINVL